jgi:hypothetical protein
MTDPLKVFRFGASGMGTWDIPFDSKIKAADITRYVKDAVAVHKAKS